MKIQTWTVLLVGLFSVLFFGFSGMAGPARYIFYFIGDGMGFPQVYASDQFWREKTGEGLVMLRLPIQGEVTTHSLDSVRTDSSAAATALATGYKASSGVLSLDPAGNPVPTLAEMARERGWKVGIVTTVAVNDATPAAFYAHQPSRLMRYEIGLDLINSDFDFFAGWGMASRRGPGGDRADLLDLALARGFTLVQNRQELAALQPGTGPVLALLPFQFEIERGTTGVSLAEATEKAIAVLDNPHGFFLMVEGGKIDWTCHTNDAASTMWEMAAFDQAVAHAVSFASERPGETLIVVTGDHETGGMVYPGTDDDGHILVLAQQVCSYETVSERLRAIEARGEGISEVFDLARECYGLWALPGMPPAGISAPPLNPEEIEAIYRAWALVVNGEEETIRRLFAGYHPVMITLNRMLSQRAGIRWSHFGHGPDPVPVYALGSGHELFQGMMDNTDLFWKIRKAAGWTE